MKNLLLATLFMIVNIVNGQDKRSIDYIDFLANWIQSSDTLDQFETDSVAIGYQLKDAIITLKNFNLLLKHL